MTDDSLRVSEALPQPEGTNHSYTDRDVRATCPKCENEITMLDCDTRFQSSTTTYSCPADGEVLAVVRRQKGGDITVDARVGLSIAIT
ncbi:hypothetical protein GS551_18565 [Rhodococcus hoagii]|uniref:Uncharacterized protein n=1 Tax=Rhodococcus hoagii TaxID=43767 RepID=A0AAE2W9A6_RHOHA|nr:hypothetical protein [Prescottella equi]NKS12592.1 hypothetical protein [Prescottella equi]